jgi:Na+/H+ antiporter NhaD/arsenite permease-like protein
MIAQILASVIFLVMFIMIVLDKYERHIVTLTGAVLVIALVFGLAMHSGHAMIEILNVQSVFQTGFWYGELSESTVGINWSTIIFIAGMMVMVEGMGRTGFFRWLCLRLAKMVKYRIMPLIICFMCMSGFLAMFIDGITVILFWWRSRWSFPPSEIQSGSGDRVRDLLRESRRRRDDVRRPAEHHHRNVAGLYVL